MCSQSSPFVKPLLLSLLVCLVSTRHTVHLGVEEMMSQFTAAPPYCNVYSSIPMLATA